MGMRDRQCFTFMSLLQSYRLNYFIVIASLRTVQETIQKSRQEDDWNSIKRRRTTFPEVFPLIRFLQKVKLKFKPTYRKTFLIA